MTGHFSATACAYFLRSQSLSLPRVLATSMTDFIRSALRIPSSSPSTQWPAVTIYPRGSTTYPEHCPLTTSNSDHDAPTASVTFTRPMNRVRTYTSDEPTFSMTAAFPWSATATGTPEINPGPAIPANSNPDTTATPMILRSTQPPHPRADRAAPPPVVPQPRFMRCAELPGPMGNRPYPTVPHLSAVDLAACGQLPRFARSEPRRANRLSRHLIRGVRFQPREVSPTSTRRRESSMWAASAARALVRSPDRSACAIVTWSATIISARPGVG